MGTIWREGEWKQSLVCFKEQDKGSHDIKNTGMKFEIGSIGLCMSNREVGVSFYW